MLSRSLGRLARRCLLPTRTTHHYRTIFTSPLDKRIFNPDLYHRLTSVWLGNIDTSGTTVDKSAVQRWFLAPPLERASFDVTCRTNFGAALNAIGPESHASVSASPFLRELEDIARTAEDDADSDGSKAAWTALSIAILLDQIPRNIFRDDVGLRKVYGHYDIISQAYIRALFSPASPIPRPDLHPSLRDSTAHRMWFYMPFSHSEDIEMHQQLDKILENFGGELEGKDGVQGSKELLMQQVKAEREHKEILDRFGRYPHRNRALERESTEEEVRFLEEGGATFEVAQSKK